MNLFSMLLWLAVDCGPTFTGHNNRYESTTMLLHRDQIHGSHKCRASEGERSFMLLHVAADICRESMVPLIVSEYNFLQISRVRITEYWLVRALSGQEFSLATAMVVLQTDQASQAATHFHQNDQHHAYSYDLKGLVAQEYQSTKVFEPLVSWNMGGVWQRDEQRERNRRARLKDQYGMGAYDSLGNLVNC